MSKLSFPISKLLEPCACLDGLQRLSKSLVGPYDGTTVVNYYDNVEYFNTDDLLWALKLTQLTDNEIRTIVTKVAIYAARSVLHVFENEFPNDPRPRRAIEAAEECVATNFSDESVAEVVRTARAKAWLAAKSAKSARSASAARAAASAAATSAATWLARATIKWAIDADPGVKSEIKNYALELIRSYDNEYCALDKLYTLHESSK